MAAASTVTAAFARKLHAAFASEGSDFGGGGGGGGSGGVGCRRCGGGSRKRFVLGGDRVAAGTNPFLNSLLGSKSACLFIHSWGKSFLEKPLPSHGCQGRYFQDVGLIKCQDCSDRGRVLDES